MGRGVGQPKPKRGEARARFEAALRDLAKTGEVTPCAGRPEWTSEHITDRRLAVEGCETCPVKALCWAVAVAEKHRCGVWAGKDRGDPRGAAADRAAEGPASPPAASLTAAHAIPAPECQPALGGLSEAQDGAA